MCLRLKQISVFTLLNQWMCWKEASAKKNKYKQMIDVFNQHIYVQSRHFRTQNNQKKGEKNLKYIFFLSHIKITQDLSSRPWWDRFSFSFSLSPGRDNVIVQEIFQSWMKIHFWNWEKADGWHFLPEPRRHCYHWILLVYSKRRDVYQLTKPGWNEDWTKGFVGLFTFNKRLFSTCRLSCVWSWGRIVNSTFILEKHFENKSDCPITHSKRQMTVICHSREKSCTLSKRKKKKVITWP